MQRGRSRRAPKGHFPKSVCHSRSLVPSAISCWPRSRSRFRSSHTAVYRVAEAVGGWRSHSLALIADAGHMLSDVAALGLSLFAAWMSRLAPTPARSYGYHRTEILAALGNAATLIAISVWVCIEA